MIYLALLLLLACVLWLGHGVWRINRVSRGAKIGDRPNTALLLIDLQAVFWDGDPYSAADKTRAERALKQAVETARAGADAVIAIRQEWSDPATKTLSRLLMKGTAIAGSAGTELAKPFRGLADHELVKGVQDSFETGALDVLLQDLQVGHLRIAGLDGNYCVAKTALAARERGYDVEILRDGVLSADEPRFDRFLKQRDPQIRLA